MKVLHGDCRDVLPTLDAATAQCCVTSPPYWGLRDYGVAGQLGLEKTPEEYVAQMVAVFREVRRVLKGDGTLWLNLGDSYAAGTTAPRKPTSITGPEVPASWAGRSQPERCGTPPGMKTKDLVGIPWKTAQALQAPYYTGRIARERDRVWLAGMIDAEGTICGFDHDRADDGSHRSGLHLTITNTSTALLDEAARIWPTSRSRHQRPYAGHLGTMDSWRWIVHGIENKMAALREIYPYLVAKRTQAIVGYTLLTLMSDAKRLGHSPQKDAVLAKRRVLTGLLSDLNHQRRVTLPDWLVEPPGMFEPGWYLRADIIWHKPNPMPESVADRPTKAHEYVFLMSKSARYFYDKDAIAEDASSHYGTGPTGRGEQAWTAGSATGQPQQDHSGWIGGNGSTRNARTVWTIPTSPFSGAHFATFPPELAARCIKAGSREGDTILDPFGGAGTVGLVADRLSRHAVLIELNPSYAEMATRRIVDDAPLFNSPTSSLTPSAPVGPRRKKGDRWRSSGTSTSR